MTLRKSSITVFLAIAAGLASVVAQDLRGSNHLPDRPFVSVTVTVNRAVKHQTILGWGGTLSFNRNLNFMDQPVIDQLIDDLVENLGMTFLRVQDEVLDEPLNDNGDPNVIDWSRFHDGALIDRGVTRGLGRFVSQVRARGQQPTIMIVKDWRGSIPAWMNDAEMAEHLFATVKYYKDHHNIDVGFINAVNEPDPSTFPVSRQAAVAQHFDARARAAGLATRLTFNEGRSADSTLAAATALQGDSAFWSRIGLISWHGPGSTDAARMQLRDFARTRQIPTAMTGFPGATIADLFHDLTQANASYWARNWILESGLAAESNNNTYFATGYDGVSFRHNQAYHRFREVMGYIPQGAVRVEATASDPSLRVAAFEKDDLVYVVGFNPTATDMRVGMTGTNLPFSTTTRYVWAYSGPEGTTVPITPTGFFPSFLFLPPNEVGSDYPVPPAVLAQSSIPTLWFATPSAVTGGATTVRLRARAAGFQRAGDFGDTVPPSYDWRLVGGPNSSQVDMYRERDSADVWNLQPGTYEFSVRTGYEPFTNSARRTLKVRVFGANQAPVITEGYRYYRDEWLVRPKSSETYGPDFISAADIEGDPVTTSFSVISQPQGASAAFNGATVTGMTHGGEYTFRFTASDPTHTVTRTFTRYVVDDDSPKQASVGRQRPADAPETGKAVARSSSANSAPAVAPPSSAGAGKSTVSRLGVLLDGLVTGELAGLPEWRRIQTLDADEDGEIDLLVIEFIDGLVWTVVRRN